jgi:membrane protease YdiL (CAAX protease family)
MNLVGLPMNGYSFPGLIRRTISQIGITLSIFIVGSWICVRFLDKRKWETFGLSFRGTWLRELGLGILAGIVFSGAIFVVEWLMGWIDIQGLAWNTRPPQEMLAVLYLAILDNVVVAFMEEIPFRGYLLQTLEEWLGTPTAVIITSALFGIMHLMNASARGWTVYVIPFTLTLFGFMMASAYLARRSLWIPIGLHFAWNFCEYEIFGLTGASPESATFLITKVTGPSLWVGAPNTSFGPEVGLLGVLAALLCIGMFWLIRRKKMKPAR